MTKGDNAESKKGRVVILVHNMSSSPVLHFYQVSSKYSEGYLSSRADIKSISNKTKGDNSKRKPELSFLYATCRPTLFYIFSKYHQNIPKGIKTYRADKKQCTITVSITKGDNVKTKKGRVVILAHDTSSHPVLHFYQVPSKYSKGYLSYSADMKSISNKTKRNNSKSQKARVVILECDRSSHPVLHFYQVSSKYSKGYSSYRADKKFQADIAANGIRPIKSMSPTLWCGGGT